MYIFEEPTTLQECLERLKQACEILYDECEYPEDYSYFNPPATEEQIQRMEQRLGFTLPDGYRQFLKFANGARIMGNSATIYDLSGIGVPDHMVPAGYLTIGEVIGDGERIAISETDGKIYSCYNGKTSPWNFEKQMLWMLEQCDEAIESSRDDREREERRKAGMTEEQEYEELIALIMAEKKRIEEEKRKAENHNE